LLIYFRLFYLKKKVQLIIIAFKYGQENRRDLIAQIKALNIKKYNFPQLSKLVLLKKIVYYILLSIK
jgi:hypothetical protein